MRISEENDRLDCVNLKVKALELLEGLEKMHFDSYKILAFPCKVIVTSFPSFFYILSFHFCYKIAIL